MLSTPFGNDCKDTPPELSFSPRRPADLDQKNGRVKVFGYVLKPGRGYGDNFVHVHPNPKRFGRFHKKLYERWKAAGQPSGDAMDDFILDRLRHWMPSQQAWTIIPVYRQNLALICASVYISAEILKNSRN